MEIHPAPFQRLPAVPATKKSKVPNLYEAGREYVEQEAADELRGLTLFVSRAVPAAILTRLKSAGTLSNFSILPVDERNR